MQKKQNSRSIGNFGEDVVCDFLVRHGYEILARNYTIRGGEIDIIAKKGETIAFVEVKTRMENSLTTGEEAITESKKKHIIKTAQCFFDKLEEPCDCRFDVAVVQVHDKKVKRLKYYVSAFDASKR
ncbi:MAG: YraN family protein [Hominimerdicola sp.]